MLNMTALRDLIFVFLTSWVYIGCVQRLTVLSPSEEHCYCHILVVARGQGSQMHQQQNIWSYTARCMTTTSGSHGYQSDPRRLWSFLERIRAVTRPPDREREREGEAAQATVSNTHDTMVAACCLQAGTLLSFRASMLSVMWQGHLVCESNACKTDHWDQLN